MPHIRSFPEIDPPSARTQGDDLAAMRAPVRDGWFGRFLPERGQGRIAWIALSAAVVILKSIAIFHLRADSDETQHAHVVWAWTQGQLPYRDIFDNHMPLFHLACVPLMNLLGEHARILIELRLAMLPLFFVCLWCVFNLTESLFSRSLAPWACLAAAAWPGFFYTSTEFRPDILWASLWLGSLVTALCGRFSLRRAFAFGILLGLDLAVSIKTPVLWSALAISAAIALGLNEWLGNEKTAWRRIPLFLGVIACGAALVPGAIVLFFAAKGAFWIMYYCLIQHNFLPGLKRWGHPSFDRWIFPASIPVLIGLGVLAFRQAPDGPTAIRRVIVLLTPCFVAILLWSYAPDITRQDGLPYLPLLPLAAIPFLIWLQTRVKLPGLEAGLFTWVLPVICFVELLCIWNFNPLRTNRLKVTTHSIQDVLLLTQPNDYVMDAEGDYIFRPRPYYWVIETVTRARMRLGLIRDSLPECLEKTGTGMCYLYSEGFIPATTLFIVSNYISFDKDALDLGVAGKELKAPSGNGTFYFDVAIPVTYAIVSESGITAGELDGAPYRGPVRLDAGHHMFHRTSGAGRAAIFLDRALAGGFQPLFDASEKIIAQEQARAANRGRRIEASVGVSE